MLHRIGTHVRNQWMGTLALFVALGGTAYAAATIGSAEIIDGSIASVDVKNGGIGNDDLAANAVRAPKVLDESLTGHDIQDNTIGGADVNETLLDPLTHAQIKDESLTGHDIQDNTIGGADINESFLPAVSTFSTHAPQTQLRLSGNLKQVIWTGDNGIQGSGETGGAYIHLDAPGRVLATASLQLFEDLRFANDASITCRLGLIQNGVTVRAIGFSNTEEWYVRANVLGTQHQMSLVGGTNVPAGDYAANVQCSGTDNMYFRSGTLMFSALPG